MLCRILWLGLAAAFAAAAQKYDGPRPPKPDVPYLKHADTLIPTEAVMAKEEKKKDRAGGLSHLIQSIYDRCGNARPHHPPAARQSQFQTTGARTGRQRRNSRGLGPFPRAAARARRSGGTAYP